MGNQKYNIVMRTPVGLRHGEICLCKDSGSIDGTLTILEWSAPFHGTVDEYGNCTFSGAIKTLMKTMQYTATGRFSENAIDLKVQAEKMQFQITGTAASESEGIV